jgi:hypothetical protein
MAVFRCWIDSAGETELNAMLVTIAAGWHATIEEAAREFVETQEVYAESDSDRAVMLGKSKPAVSVRDLATGKLFKVTVSGELMPTYYASRAIEVAENKP